jgi:hypothetical protein
MNQAQRTFADKALKRHLRELLPWYLWFTPRLVYRGVQLGGGTAAWNSCGPTRGFRCRHNIVKPGWMRKDEANDG